MIKNLQYQKSSVKQVITRQLIPCLLYQHLLVTKYCQLCLLYQHLLVTKCCQLGNSTWKYFQVRIQKFNNYRKLLKLNYYHCKWLFKNHFKNISTFDFRPSTSLSSTLKIRPSTSTLKIRFDFELWSELWNPNPEAIHPSIRPMPGLSRMDF